MKKQIVLLFTALVMLGSCADKTSFNIKGTLYQDCARVPRANVPLALTSNGATLATATTNAQGEFAFAGEGKVKEELKIIYNERFNSSSVLEKVPSKPDYSLEVFSIPQAWANVLLNTSKNYTTADTLFFGVFTSNVPEKQILGPFTSGKLDSIIFMPNVKIGLEASNPRTLFWGLGRVDFNKAGRSGGDSPYNQIKFSAVTCEGTDVTINLP